MREDINKDKNGTRFYDIELRIKDSNGWYFGTDGKPPAYKNNVVHMRLHELFHGIHMEGLGYKFKQVVDHSEAVPRTLSSRIALVIL